MNVFPQLLTGAIQQETLERRAIFRTVVNELASGVRYRYQDDGASRVAWRLTLEDLLDEERQALDALFQTCAGRLHSFTFLDSNDNLVRHSEDYSNAVWVRSPSLSLSNGQVDPWGTTRATEVVNTGQATARLSQPVAAPGWYQYVATAYVRADDAASPELFLETQGASRRLTLSVDGQWRRFRLSGRMVSSGETIELGIEILPGESVYVCGLQLEAQVVEGDYKRTTQDAGVYPAARFASDELSWTSTAPGRHTTVVDILGR